MEDEIKDINGSKKHFAIFYELACCKVVLESMLNSGNIINVRI